MPLRKAVRRGRVDEKLIDEAAVRVIRQKARFHGVGESDYRRAKVACHEHTELALEAARKGIVLLKNEKRALPLRRDVLQRIAVIGRLADTANIGDRGSSRVRPPYVVTPLEGIRLRSAGSVEVVYESRGNLQKAVEVAEGADVSVVVVGLTYRDEGEYISSWLGTGGDREELTLPGGQEELIMAVAAASPCCVVVVEAGSAVVMDSWKEEVDAILYAWYPGMEGGKAIGEALFGDFNPGGRLPVTFPRSKEQLPFFDKKARSIKYGYYHGYRHFDREGFEPAFAFGFGLSYTEFSYSNLRLGSREVKWDGTLEISVDVENVGEVPGDEVVQLYVGYPASKVDRPVKELKGFQRVSLEPGEKKTVTMALEPRDLAYYDAEKSSWVVEKIDYEILVGSSSRSEDLLLRGSFTVV